MDRRKELIKAWGPEVILRCECRDVPGHYMDGKIPKCPICRSAVTMLTGESWEEIRERNKRG